jgi:acyl-CoA synthetase (AMP-forming)/AMP-acid ligase II/acyl carrier protein
MTTNLIQPTTLVELLRLRAQNLPEKLAYTFLVDGESKEINLTYAELDQQAQVIATQLQGITTMGERALLLYPPGLDYIAAFFGCLYAGIIAVPTYPPRRNRPDPRIQAIVTDAQASVVLTTTKILSDITPRLVHTPALKNLHWIATDNLTNNFTNLWQNPKIHSDTLAFLQYTSGSTGTPKGVMVSHGNLLYNEKMLSLGFGHTEKTIGVGWLPLFHDMGLIGNVLQPLYLGIPCILMSPMSFLQKPFRWLKAISHYRASTSGGPNFAYNLCVQKITDEQREQLDLSSWEVAFIGAEPIRAEMLEQFTSTFKACGFRREAFYPCYGMAECTLFISGGLKKVSPIISEVEKASLQQNYPVVIPNEKNTQKIVSCGQTWLEQKIVVVEPESFISCSEQQVGEIWVSGQNIAQGYWNKPDETKKTFHAYLADTGEGPFLRTGDLGFLKEGELFVTGRLKDLIIIRGKNYYPQDIEFTVEQSYPALCPECSAAFSIEVNGEEQLVIVTEVERRYKKNRRQQKTYYGRERRSGFERRQLEMMSCLEQKAYQQFNVEETIDAIRQGVSKQHEISIFTVLLLRIGTIPKTSSGKIQRHACRDQFLANTLNTVGEWRQNLASEPSVLDKKTTFLKNLVSTSQLQTAETIQNWLITHISEKLKISPTEIDVQQPLTHYGVDSVMAANLSGELEAELGYQISPLIIYDYPTIQALTQYLTKLPSSENDKYPITPTPLTTTDTPSLEEQMANVDQLSDEEVDVLLNEQRLINMNNN